MPTVGVTVLPKQVLAKHRTSQTTNCHSPAKKRKSRSSDHQQHKQKMKETKRKQKHPNWVVRVRRRRRNATATKQTSPKKTQKHRDEKDWQKLPKQEKEGKPVYTYAYTNTLKGKKSLTHWTRSTYPKCTSTHLNPGFLAVQPAKAGAQKPTRHKHKQTKRTQSGHATQNTPVIRTCPRVLTFRVALCCSCSTSAQTHTHRITEQYQKKKTLDEETKHGEDKTETSEHKAGMQQSPHLKRVRCCSPYLIPLLSCRRSRDTLAMLCTCKAGVAHQRQSSVKN